MRGRPRKPEKPILSRPDTRWFVVAGPHHGIATMAIAAGAEHDQGEKLARPIGEDVTTRLGGAHDVEGGLHR
jgi:hypothetical protein